MPKVVYNTAAEEDLTRLTEEQRQKVTEWEKTVALPDSEPAGYLRDLSGDVYIWFQVENDEIHVCDLRAATG